MATLPNATVDKATGKQPETQVQGIADHLREALDAIIDLPKASQVIKTHQHTNYKTPLTKANSSNKHQSGNPKNINPLDAIADLNERVYTRLLLPYLRCDPSVSPFTGNISPGLNRDPSNKDPCTYTFLWVNWLAVQGQIITTRPVQTALSSSTFNTIHRPEHGVWTCLDNDMLPPNFLCGAPASEIEAEENCKPRDLEVSSAGKLCPFVIY
ncbi:hypothetical protein NW752_011580 [Fusarium irregulare]|nr:hypothetical protein NW752_011580 [Fusarium irregulare]